MKSSSIERALIEELVVAGCREFVVCGGARNASLIAHLVVAEGLKVWTHFEERGAAFFALGRCKDHGEPCAVVTTSGTAVAECLPAVIEAFYSEKPLIIVSADRPESFRGSGAPQVIEQESLFGVYATTDLSTWPGHKPLHLNLPLLESEVKVDPWVAEVAEFRPAKRKFEVKKLRNFLDDGVFRGLILMVGGLEPEDREEVFEFARALGCPVIADVNSGIREILGSLLIPESSISKNLPGRILRLGEVPVGRLWRDLEDHPKTEVLSICRNGLPGLARPSKVIQGEVDRVLRGLGLPDEVGDVRDDFSKGRYQFSERDEFVNGEPDSEIGIINLLSVYATTGESLYLGNSLPIREWNDYGQRETPYHRVFANRGANGIDGQLSTWLGATAESPDAWGVFGDLTTLYDLAAPALLNQVESKGRVLVVINNNGGRIFEKLPRLAGMNVDQQRAMIQPQVVDLKSWGKMWDLDYLQIRQREDFDQLEPSERPLLVEIIVG